MSRVAILGAGDVGGAIGTALSRAGHDVVFGTRGVDRTTDDGLPIRGYREAVAGARAVIIAVPGSALRDTLRTHTEILDGQLLIDATNDIESPQYHQLELFREYVPAARVARAWCSVGWPNFLEPTIDGHAIDMLWCGPSGVDGDVVASLISDTGLHPVRVGDLSAAHIVDMATRLTLSLIFEAGFPHRSGLKILR